MDFENKKTAIPLLTVPNQCSKLLQVKLPSPKDNKLQLFLYDEDNIALYEVVRFNDKFKSWFLDNTFCEDGHLNIITKVDPLFVLLPQIIKYANEQFRTMHDICLTYSSGAIVGSSKLDYALSPYINWTNICDTQEIDDELFIRYSETKTLAWLQKKHLQTVEKLKLVLASDSSRATLISYANDLIYQYLPQNLGEKFKVAVREGCSSIGKTTDTQEVKVAAKRSAVHLDKSQAPRGSILNFLKKKS